MQQIVEFETTTFTACRKIIQLPGLSDCDCNGLTSCSENNCLYVSDSLKDVVYKVEMSGNNQVSGWTVDSGPEGLSVNSACNVLVACHKACVIQEYTAKGGNLIRRIALIANEVKLSPYHVVQLTTGQYVVSYSYGNPMKPLYGVSEVDDRGRIVFKYDSELESTTHSRFSWPNRLAVDKSSRYILVADANNHRILIIDRSSRGARQLSVSRDNELCQPSCLHLDKSRDRLFVSEFDDFTRRIFVFDDVTNSKLSSTSFSDVC
jgi:DNA-binding beta-propeller fold protein YncE